MFKAVNPQPDFAAQEEEILDFWERERIFEKSVKQNEGKPLYVVYDGPPTANARPPLHTIVPMSFKDLAGRYHTMKGEYVPRQAGWDTHGLPVEVQVEKALGLSGKKEILNLVPGDEAASIKLFNEHCRQSVWEFKQDWDKFVPRVGYWTDTKHPYITYDSHYIEKVWGVFKQVWDKGLVYKDYKVVPYCPRCGTGLSAAEVALGYEDVKDTSVFIKFKLKGSENRFFLAWTTTPWTLPGNVALAVGEGIQYVEILQTFDNKREQYFLAKDRLEVVRGEYEILQEVSGKDLLGMEYEPLYPAVLEQAEGKKYVVLPADFVTTEDGTGIVHTAVMYGEDDFNLGKANGLPAVHSVGLDGKFLPNVAEFAGLDVKEALVPILKDLTEKGVLYAKQTITHSYPFCWRCKSALLYYAKDSWYIAMSKLRTELVKSNEGVEWYPEHIKDGRFGDFVREARDWAVSRERFWGTPLPIWLNAKGESLCIGSYAELRSLAKDPGQIPEDFDPHRPGVDQIVLVKDGVEYRREPYVLDVWFDSGSMPYASGRLEKGEFPADYIAEAVDQTRGWFYSMLAISTVLYGYSAYKRVVCMGHLVDENGRKMSKSLGNVFDPWETFKITGVDAIRWYLYTVNSPGEAKAFGIKELQSSFRRSHLLLWNVFNYFVTYANIAGFEPLNATERTTLRNERSYQGKSLSELDRWILSRQADVSKSVTELLDSYDFMRAGRSIEQYINDLSTWYLRRSRKREDPAFFAVLYDVLQNIAGMLAPMTPFMVEEIFQTLKHNEAPQSVHLTEWVGALAGRDEGLEKDMALVRQSVELGLAVRAQEKIKVRQPLARAFIQLPENQGMSEELQQILADELNVGEIQVVAEIDPGYPSKSEATLTVALDTTLTDELIAAGRSRELLRHIQNLRKQTGLQPGQQAVLLVGEAGRAAVEPLLQNFPSIAEDAFISISEKSWQQAGDQKVELDGQTIYLGLDAHVE